MIVCVAEKPSVAREIASILGATTRRDGYMEGNGYQITWVFGHLCELKEPHEYDPTWKRWELFYLPMIPAKFGIRLKNDPGVEKQFKIISNLIANADRVVNCGDAGQEGELIQRWVYQKAGCKCPVDRLWISSLTEDAIREGFQSLKPQESYNKLYEAGAMRAIGDWLLGMNATRAYTLKYGHNKQVLSIGRVQTPTLALVVARYREIQNFVPEQYWELKTLYRDVVFNSTHGKFTKEEEGKQFLETIQNCDFVVDSVSKKNGTELAPRLFDLTALQVECNKKFNMSAELTLQTIQSLYEKKFTTYPRVDTTYLPEDMYPKIPSILGGLKSYANEVTPVLSGKISKTKKIFDNSKITDHHAIIPTGIDAVGLNDFEKNVYDTVTRRFIANFYPECQIATTTVLGHVADVEFKTTGKQILKPGWRALYAKDKQVEEEKADGADENKTLPDFVEGEQGPHKPELAEKWTTPPKLYTEATLLRAMETAGKFVDDEELRDVLKLNGIGRPSTRASILETLYKRHYMRKEGKKNIVPTQTGLDLIDAINEELLKSAELTGQWEKKLRMIENNTYDGATFMSELKDMVSSVVNHVKMDNSRQTVALEIVKEETEKNDKKKTTAKKKPATPKEKKQEAQVWTCPVCKKGSVIKGKSAYGCSEWKTGCAFRLPFSVMNYNLTDEDAYSLVSGKTITINGKNCALSSDGVIGEV